MNTVRSFGLGLLVAGLFVASCARKEQLPETRQPELRSVSVSSDMLVLDARGDATLLFSVQDPDFSFRYNVSSGNCQVVLMGPGGTTPSEFSLVEVAPSEERGIYHATLRDNGTDQIYEKLVCLAIARQEAVSGQQSFVTSSYFTVRSLAQAPPPGQEYLETGLPVVYVDTQNGAGITSKEVYVPASLHIRGTGSLDGLETVNCSIRGRGNTTWWWPKKPYLIKLDQKEHIFGMHKHKRWVLLANFMDRTLMRNLVSMKVSSFTSLDWTPGCVPVELVLNGQHQGSYLLIEQVRVDNHRVAVTEMSPEDNSGEAVTGGYLLECDFHYDNEVQWTDPHGRNAQWGSGVPFGVKYPDPDEITPAQLSYIKGYVAETADVLYGENFTDPENGYAKYIDVDSFVDYWIVFEVMCNHELGNPGSVFMHKDRGGKLVAGPCWDFDWGVLSFYTSGGETALVNGRAIWYERLFQDPAFKAKVKARFEELLQQLQTIPDYMDACEALLRESAELNFQMWNPSDDRSQNGGSIINGDENLSFHDAVLRLKRNYEKHLQVMQEKL